MRITTLVNRITKKETLLILTLSICGFYFFSIRPIFAEYGDGSMGSGISRIVTPPARTLNAKEENWASMQSSYFAIYYKPGADLKAIERKLKRRKFYVSESLRPGYSSSPSQKVAYRMDVLFRRAKEILGMYPRVKDVKIKIFKNQRELSSEYYRIFRKNENPKSFYIYKYNVIYTSEDNISDSVIVHEMGHAIVDHYFAVRPPEKIREILSMYVDAHLDD